VGCCRMTDDDIEEEDKGEHHYVMEQTYYL
jgi:hypothetical protein